MIIPLSLFLHIWTDSHGNTTFSIPVQASSAKPLQDTHTIRTFTPKGTLETPVHKENMQTPYMQHGAQSLVPGVWGNIAEQNAAPLNEEPKSSKTH